MKFLYVACRWPWPVVVGRQRMLDQIPALASEMAEVHMAAFAGAEVDPAKRPAHVKTALVVKTSGIGDIAASLLMHPLYPLQAHLFNGRAARQAVIELIRRENPDAVMFGMTRLTGLADQVRRAFPGKRLVLDMDDLMSLRYERMLADNKLGGIAGTFEKKLPVALRFVARVAPRLLLTLEAKLMARQEKRAYRLFDNILLASPKEAGNLNDRHGGDKAVGFPPQIRENRSAPRDYSRSLRFVFLGNAKYAPNAESLLLLDRVARRLKDRLPAPATPYVFEIAGTPNPDLALPNLNLLGFVDDLSDFLGGDAVLVAPVMTGSGIKTKIIDSLEYAMPIITTELGAEGLPLEKGLHYIAAEGEDGLLEALAKLVSDQEARGRLEAMGRAALETASRTNNRTVLLADLRRVIGAPAAG